MRDAPMWTATLPAGPRGTIADVPGVTVGHCTLDAGNVQTGVTVEAASGRRTAARCRLGRR